MAVFIDLRPQLKHIRLLYIFIGILVCTASFKGCHSGKLGEYNISQPYELVNPWDICDWRCVIDPNDDFYSPKDIRKYCCK